MGVVRRGGMDLVGLVVVDENVAVSCAIDGCLVGEA